MRDSKTESGRGGGRGSRGRGFGRGGGGRGYDRDSRNTDTFGGNNGFSGGDRPFEEGGGKPSERRSYGAPRGSFRGGHRGGFGDGESGDGERPRRLFERRSGTGRGFVLFKLRCSSAATQ